MTTNCGHQKLKTTPKGTENKWDPLNYFIILRQTSPFTVNACLVFKEICPIIPEHNAHKIMSLGHIFLSTVSFNLLIPKRGNLKWKCASSLKIILSPKSVFTFCCSMIPLLNSFRCTWSVGRNCWVSYIL